MITQGLRTAIRTRSLRRPLLHQQLWRNQQQVRVPFARQYSPYPKEGVFQPNSPPRTPGPPKFTPEQNVAPQQQFYPEHYFPSPQPPPPNDEPESNFSKIRRRVWPFLVYTTGAVLVLYGYETMCRISAEYIQDPLEPGSLEDRQELEALAEDFDSLPFVQQLRSMELIHDDDTVTPVWEEWWAYEGFTDLEARDNRLTTGPLKGSQGFAAQRVFYDDKADSPHMMLFINFGRGCCGWPNVVHGGAIATICDEGLGRFAILSTAERAAVTASLEINYQQPCRPGEWYVLHVSFDESHKSTDRKKFVQASLFCVGDQGPIIEESSSQGPDNVLRIENCHQHVSTKGLFVVPKGVNLRPLPSTF